jgi:hypothetical protein
MKYVNKKDEYLIYETNGRYGMPKLTHMEGKAYDTWVVNNPDEAHKYPVVMRGLTYELAKKMMELTKEG